MKNKQVYLPNGQLADLIAELDRKYLVAPHLYYEPYYSRDGEQYEEAYSAPSDSMILVDKIFDKPPIPFIQEEFKNIKAEIKEQEKIMSAIRKEHSDLTHEINSIKNQKTDLEKMIINRNEFKSVKTLWAFPTGRLLPKEYTADRYDGFKFSFSFETWKGVKGEWITQLEYDTRNYNSDNIDSKFGLLINKTKEEIDQITKERIAFYPITHWHNYRGETGGLESVDDSLLTPALIAVKTKQIEDKKQEQKEKTEKELKELQDKLEALKSKV